VKGADPIPRVKLEADGTLDGSVVAGETGHKHTITVTGHLAKGGSAAVLTLHSTPSSGNVRCATQAVTVTA
jgi:hypothetical protein